jgi:Immunity protein Imm5
MSLPEKLGLVIDQAREAVYHHPQHHLECGYRYAIFSAFGPFKGSPAYQDKKGWQRRLVLAIETTRHVLPLWEQALPHNTIPQRALTLAKRSLISRINEEQIWKARNTSWVQLLDLGNNNEELQSILGVGFAALQALSVALQDEQFDESEITLDTKDQDSDPETLDASYFAAAAFAHGTIWEEQSSSSKRRAFWEWWLNEAVPLAWNAI